MSKEVKFVFDERSLETFSALQEQGFSAPQAFICFDQSRGKYKTLWVSQKRGDGGVDWGYSSNPNNAVPLTDRMAKIYINELGSSQRQMRKL